ncbi:MAG TPA: ATP-binding cassette domain-containing protein [Thermoanaerobaculia bacterium]|nr:ATP-binding cassette domain-containing protein [Thermoanaerobaculia bacterium]
MSFAVKPGSVYALVGREGSGKTAVIRCVLGELSPESGRVFVLEMDPRRERRAIRRRIRFHEKERELRIDTDRPTVLRVTDDPRRASTADRIGFLKEGRLVLDDERLAIESRFRRIRYVNEQTEARTEYGTELDAFDAVRVRVRGWGVDAVVSNFDDAIFERLRQTDGVSEAQALPMTLEEIFEAVGASVGYNYAK